MIAQSFLDFVLEEGEGGADQMEEMMAPLPPSSVQRAAEGTETAGV